MPPGPTIHWERLPLARELPLARDWLRREAQAGLSAVTVDAYSRAVERYLAYCHQRRIDPGTATTAHLAAYLDELASAGLGRAALQQRLTALRLFYSFVVERGRRPDNPAAGPRTVPLLDRPGAIGEPDDGPPWVPSEPEWMRVLEAASRERLRSQVMLALAYEGALRREEVCALDGSDVAPDGRGVRVPVVGTAGSERTRAFPLSPAVAEHLAAYRRERGTHADDTSGETALFVSESPRNRARPITVWTWAKVTRGIAARSGVARFTTQTPRHLRLADLARAGRSAAAIARFAGYRRTAQALPYLRLARALPGPAGDAIEQRRSEQLRRVLFRGDR